MLTNAAAELLAIAGPDRSIERRLETLAIILGFARFMLRI
jgi:hypothetical protein